MSPRAGRKQDSDSTGTLEVLYLAVHTKWTCTTCFKSTRAACWGFCTPAPSKFPPSASSHASSRGDMGTGMLSVDCGSASPQLSSGEASQPPASSACGNTAPGSSMRTLAEKGAQRLSGVSAPSTSVLGEDAKYSKLCRSMARTWRSGSSQLVLDASRMSPGATASRTVVSLVIDGSFLPAVYEILITLECIFHAPPHI